MKTVIITHLIAFIGALFFLVLGLPLPWLFGPMFACLIAAFARVQLQGVSQLNNGMRTFLGVAAGLSVNATFFASLIHSWPTLLMIPVMVFLIGFFGVPYFRRLCGYDFATSYYAAMPGGLHDMLLFGQEAGGNLRSLSLIHATRVLVIVLVLPVLLTTFWGSDLMQLPGMPAQDLPIDQLMVMIFCAMFGWWGAKKIGLFGASILGPLIVAAVMSLLGILDHRLPAELVWAAQFFIGITIGANYVGITLDEIKRDVLAGLGFCLLLLCLTLLAVGIALQFDLAPAQELILALAPGGQAELLVLALIVGADASFIVAHHLLRLFIVILGAPICASFLSK